MNNKLIYLASPFTHEDKDVMIQRFEIVSKVACHLIGNRKFHVFSPIAHSWPIAKQGDLPTDWEYWEENCKLFVSRCQELWIVMIPGWETSTGVLAERDYAREIGLNIKYVEPNQMIIFDEALAEQYGYVH